MARYIDGDALINWAREKAFAQNVDGKVLCLDFENAVRNYELVDVTPKSEVEELTYKLECLLCHATGGKLSKSTYPLKTMEVAVTDYIQECYDEAHDEARAEVAREIFEEVEKIVNWILSSVDIANLEDWTAYANLKKKYTEEKE